jgi:MoaA/NifB/PqqE/SkfB family radical SAM enzyme
MSYKHTNKITLKTKINNFLYRRPLFVSAYQLKIKHSKQKARLEFCSVCQLQCPLCSTGKGFNKTNLIGSGMLSLENFKNFVRLNPRIKHIESSNWGEIFLNNQFTEILEFAFKNGVTVTARNGVNFNDVTDDQLEALVKFNFERLVISIDGTTPDTYKLYRVNGSLKKVVENIKKLNKIKLRMNSPLPALTLQFIEFPHNIHQKEDAKNLAYKLGMNFVIKLNHSPKVNFAPGDITESIPINPSPANRANHYKGTKNFYDLPCRQLWHRPQINWNGEVLGCCVNKTHSFGNAFEEPMNKIFTSEKYLHTKKMLFTKISTREDTPCVNCEHYSNLKEPNVDSYS